MIAVFNHRPSVTLDRPIYLAGAILDASKLAMLKFWYERFQPTFHQPGSSDIHLLFTDTGET